MPKCLRPHTDSCICILAELVRKQRKGNIGVHVLRARTFSGERGCRCGYGVSDSGVCQLLSVPTYSRPCCTPGLGLTKGATAVPPPQSVLQASAASRGRLARRTSKRHLAPQKGTSLPTTSHLQSTLYHECCAFGLQRVSLYLPQHEQTFPFLP